MAAAPLPNPPRCVNQPTAVTEKLRRALDATSFLSPEPPRALFAPRIPSSTRTEIDSGAWRAAGTVLSLGLPIIDEALGGGLSRGALHEIAALRETAAVAATAFALALTHPRRTVAWIAEDLSLAENGVPYGPGLDEAGIAPERLIRVTASRTRDCLWAMEEALRCPAIDVVIGELRAHSIDQVATRRLSLAADTGNTLGLLLRSIADDAPSAAATRWIIAPSARRSFPPGNERWRIGPPRLAVRLVRNRRGHLGAWILEWNSVEQRFELATNSEPVARPAFDRPHRAAVA